MPRIVILNNQIMPYRVPLFNALGQSSTFQWQVLFSGQQEPDRAWSLADFPLTVAHKVLPGTYLRLPKSNFSNEYRHIWINPTLFWELMRLRPAAIIGYEYSLPAITAMLYSQLMGCAYLTWTEMTPHADRHLTRGQQFTRRLILPRTKIFLGTSPAACEGFVARGMDPKRVVLAPQPLDVDWFRQTTAALRPANRPPTVIYAGFLSERKGVFHLVQAFTKVLASVPNAELHLAGEGDQRAELEALVARLGLADSVKFLGFVQPANMPQVYAQGQVFVLPSLEDTFGVVAAEALASGLSLVCSRFAGFSSQMTSGHDGFVVQPGDHTALAGRIITLLQDAAMRDRFAQASEHILNQLTPEAVATQFDKAVTLALARHGNQSR